LGGWLYRTASFQAARLKRSEIRRQRRESKFANEEESNSAERILPEVWEPLKVALAKLSTENRDLIVMHYFQDLDYSEMANVLSLSEAATRKRMSQALADLGERLRKADGTNTAIKMLVGAVATQLALSPSPTLAASALATATPSLIFSSLATMTAASITLPAILIVMQLGIALWLLPSNSPGTTTPADELPNGS